MSVSRKAQVLQLLRNGQGYVSGQQLCEHLGISRTAVWKIINQLKKEGYQIEAVQNKGYLLAEDADVLSLSELESRLKTKEMGRSLLFLETVDSTNTEARRRAELSAPHGFLVVAEHQKKGRGRRGRSWESQAGANISMTLLLRPGFSPSKASMMTLVAALATARAIRRETGLEAKIKWPNDIVINGKKAVGILTEMNLEDDYIQYLICGIGINVNQTLFPDEIKAAATSLFLECGRKINRARLIGACMEEFEKNYEIFCQSGDMGGLLAPYQELLVNRNAKVRVLDPKGAYEGIAHGINEQGELLVEKKDGSLEQVYAGEVSVRGIYGYV